VILVDRAVYWFGGRRWCHMVSDESLAELHAFADLLGLPRRAYQDHPRRNHPHYDISEEARSLATAMGAVEVTGRELVERMYRHPPGAAGG
jgi:hypothetical protein